ncbi:hypothetical protein DYB26_012506 [Aphanomyces astaci]|uniref:Uncharacterized protein n=1 Tax=Aphanomyces astaci TaxID=112090 RepID=A0A397EM57_APHAT|nr:hypothetical protein DYB34_006904 [Aphanomyces astaci]RHY80440.1 hypothetical protein DYB26_012506 [Aphanomyces astaci]RHY88600.1 hypothetical protein DYB31_014719 [Aphanomyces astaci]
MDPDDILDDMSLSSDDEMMEDMINEMKAEVKAPPPPAPRRQPRATTVVRAAPSQPAMPDLSKMMSQMMPMMSQMFGNAPSSSSGSNRITRAMEDIVADHVPAAEVASWVETIRRDEARQKHVPRSNHSRAYRPTVAATPTAHLDASTLLQELLLPAVRAAKCGPSPRWEKEHLTIHRQLQAQGVGDIYAQDLRANLRQRAVHSSDYTATPTRFPNLTSIVSS